MGETAQRANHALILAAAIEVASPPRPTKPSVGDCSDELSATAAVASRA
jgi:hypothetical protein